MWNIHTFTFTHYVLPGVVPGVELPRAASLFVSVAVLLVDGWLATMLAVLMTVTALRIAPVRMSTRGAPYTKTEWRKALVEGTPEMLPTSDAEWKDVLEPMAYAVLREEATEPMWSSELNAIKGTPGVFLCAGCANPLFTTDSKFESGSGWPSFWAPVSKSSVVARVDFKAVVPRTEISCARCGGHLGHVFEDGPPPTGKRYCMNGAALQFERESPRAEQAVRAFAEQAATLQPPLVKPVLEATLASLLCAGLVFSFWLNLKADLGDAWAAEALRGSDTWLLGAVKVVFGRPPGGPLTLALAALNGLTVAQKIPLIQAALKVKLQGRQGATAAVPSDVSGGGL